MRSPVSGNICWQTNGCGLTMRARCATIGAVDVIADQALEVLGADPGSPGMLRVRVELHHVPDKTWLDIFSDEPGDEPWPEHLVAPEFDRRSVTSRVTAAELEQFMAALQIRVENTNAQYRRDIPNVV